MNATIKLVAPLIAVLAMAACNGGSSTMPGTTGQSTAQAPNAGRSQQLLQDEHVKRACPDEGPGTARCYALVRTDIVPQTYPASEPGLHPADFKAAYKLPVTKGAGQIVAIVDAYDNPNIANDLKTYRAEFSLSTANFTKYNQTGQQSNYPAGNVGWGLEEDLDVDMVSASCPKCTIYLIEANSTSFSDLGAAEAEAVKLGAHIVSNSYGGSCSGSCFGYGSDYNTPGVVYLASAGDDGYFQGFPAQLASVVAIGGTSLTANKKVSRGWKETVWNGTGGGCSSSTKPTWQGDPGCTFRTENDVSAAANPDAGGAAEYDSYGYGGWLVVGGTSEAAPLNAGVFGLAGNATSQTAGEKFWTLTTKQHSADLWVISSGNDGSCSPTYLCKAGTHEYKTYSGPAGWGTPKGIGAY